MAHLATRSSAAGSIAGHLAAMSFPGEPLPPAGSVVHAKQGSEIFAEGDENTSFYKVISGVVRICRFLADGRRQIEAFHVAGEVFGIEASDLHVMSAEAVNDCTLVAYSRRVMERAAQNDHAVSRQLYHYAMQGLAQAQAHCLLLGRRGAVEKVAAFLLALAERAAGSKVIHLAMTRQDIADYLGLTIETVSRTLSQFERDGLINLLNIRDVRLANVETLEDLAA